MPTSRTRGRTVRFTAVTAALLTAAALTLTACGSSADPSTDNGGTAPAVPTQDVVSHIAKDDAIAAKLPADVTSSGTLTIGTIKTPGLANLPLGGEVDGEPVGLHRDLTDAVARVLGVKADYQYGTFPSILPGVQNGRYQVGQANFSVTRDREKVVDFATFVTDGQGFLGTKKVTQDKFTQIGDACGYRIGTAPGSSFQTLLEQNAGVCAALGKPDWQVQYFTDSGPITLGLQNGKLDLYFGPSLSLQYAESRIPGTRYLGEIYKSPVGFVTAKGSPIAPALVDAVNKLISTGDYAKIFAKWNVPGNAVAKSELNPASTF
ncbi:ABC transporter substrate-binding protein [Gordonia spumicola]|uniref:ABC transporter substrate-binding protein n=1 Tax=Gordonia spumicola TaxID=589161 RepID=A0A7I9VBM2_9ACTN|nr:transporter substrate-binding domain-containing protein [Gordonia spumicola]GEE02749.1 ABC transporter substrate-binding protein [Gordonia spumicola]